MESLAQDLKRELKAKVSKTIKVKGAVNKSNLPRGYNHVITTGVIVSTQDGEDYANGDSIIEWNEIDWGTRQRARMDAQNLLNAYPPKKMEIGGKDGGPIPVTNFPPSAASLDEWQRQMEEAEARRLAAQTTTEAAP